MIGTMRVAVLQTAPRLGEVAANLRALDDQVQQVAVAGREAGGPVDIAVAPELATHGYHLYAVEDDEEAEPISAGDPRIGALGRHGPAVVTGFAEARRHHRHNSAAIVDGDQVGVQRKLFLPTYQVWEERKYFRPGDRLRYFDVRGTTIAVLICNDLWQPPLPWQAAHSGAEVLITIANSIDSQPPLPVRYTWDLLTAHAAITLQCYVIFVNRVGTECGHTFWGGSRVIGPDGSELIGLLSEPGIAVAELDLRALRALRRRWPLLQESRFDLIAREAARLAAEDDQ